MEMERDLKEHQRQLEKTPSGKTLWSSTPLPYSKYVYHVILNVGGK